MNAHYLWLAERLELLTFFAIALGIAVVIAYRAWRGESRSPKVDGARSVAWGVAAFVLFVFAKTLVADAGTPLWFLLLHFACALGSLLAFGVCVGRGGAAMLGAWRWHQKTRLT